MSDVKMPEPTAWISRDKTVGPNYGQERLGKLPIQSLNPLTYEHVRLFSEEQMEAYAAAKVREAIEQAADIANEWAMKYVEVDTAHVKVGFYILDEMKGTEI